MAELSDAHAMALERSCAVTAVALSDQRRDGVRLVTGITAHVRLECSPHARPRPLSAWVQLDAQNPDMRCGTAVFAVEGSPGRLPVERAVGARAPCAALVEAGVAIGWIASRWPGLLAELQRTLPDIDAAAGRHGCPGDARPGHHSGAQTSQPLNVHPLLGTLPLAYTMPRGFTDKLRRSFGRMPWTTTQKRLPRPYSVPVGGDGGVRNPNLPPPSRPQDNDLDITPEHRPGIPYPEWNTWTKRFMPDHVAVLEKVHTQHARASRRRSPPTSGNGSPNTPIGR